MGILDARNQEILAQREALRDAIEGPRVGDFVRFADGILRRISHIWDFADGCDAMVQTSDGGSFYLGDGSMSFSGSLYSSVNVRTLTLTEETRTGGAWFFHHDWPEAHNGIDVALTCRVYTCTENATP